MIEPILMGLSVVFFILYTILIVVAFGFWLFMLIDCLQRPKRRFPTGGEYDRLIWCLAIIFVHFIGAVLYYFLVYKKDSSVRIYQ
ncbi:MAG: PLDc N-terminal domain-containing protein [Methanosarcinales archaeon]|nr:PLDc N-terminal domain-containing protein [Methanosarcinales archaeon]